MKKKPSKKPTKRIEEVETLLIDDIIVNETLTQKRPR